MFSSLHFGIIFMPKALSLKENLATQPIIDTHILSYIDLSLAPIFYHAPSNEWAKLI